MKITLKELRSIIRESVRQHLKEETRSKSEEISSKIEEIMNKLNNNNFSETDLSSIFSIASFYKELKNKEDLKEKMEGLGKKLEELSKNPDAKFPNYIKTAKQEILDALSGRVHGETPSPEKTLRSLEGTNLVPADGIFGLGGKYYADGNKLEEGTMSLQELRSLVREAVRKQIKK